MKIFDISQTIREGMAVWPGDRKYERKQTMQIQRGDPCNVSAITMSTHTGSHVDAPCHFLDSESDITCVPLEHFLGPARVVKLGMKRCITGADLSELGLEGVQRILFKTRDADSSGLTFDPDFAYLSEEGAEFLAGKHFLLVGTDAPSIESFGSKTHGSHKTLLSHGVAILEGLQLGSVPEGDYELICLPLRLAGADGSPVRAVLRR